jgi:hypothetical protein
MSNMSELSIDIQEDIQLGALSFPAIAAKYNVPLSWIELAWEDLCDQEYEEELRDHAEDLADY